MNIKVNKNDLIFEIFKPNKIVNFISIEYNNIPTRLNVEQSKKISYLNVIFYYGYRYNSFCKFKINDKIWVYKGDDLITSSSVPMDNFDLNLQFLINWLNDQSFLQNYESKKLYYFILSKLLNKHKDELFIPFQ